MSDWIPVSERLPTEADAIYGGHVLGTRKDGCVVVFHFSRVKDSAIAWKPITDSPYVPPVEYVTPTLDDLKNGPIECEVRHHGGGEWLRGCKLRAIDVGGLASIYFIGGGQWFHYCRIKKAVKA